MHWQQMVQCADHTKLAECFCGFRQYALQVLPLMYTSFQNVWSSSLCIFKAFISAIKMHRKRQKLKKNRNIIFFLNLIAEVSCVEHFNVTLPAVETECDSCSLLKICTRELFLGGSVCVCTALHNDWWERGWDMKFSCWNDVHVDLWKASGELAYSVTNGIAVHLESHWDYLFFCFMSWYT